MPERFEHTYLHSPGPVAGFPGPSHGPGPVVLDWQERTICTEQEWQEAQVALAKAVQDAQKQEAKTAKSKATTQEGA